MIAVFNATSSPVTIRAAEHDFSVQPDKWEHLPFLSVTYDSTAYTVRFYETGTLVVDSTPRFAALPTAEGGVFVICAIAFFAWCVVSVLNRAF